MKLSEKGRMLNYLDQRFPWTRGYRLWHRKEHPPGSIPTSWEYRVKRWPVSDIGTPFQSTKEVTRMDRFYRDRLVWKSFDKKSADCLAMRMWGKTLR